MAIGVCFPSRNVFMREIASFTPAIFSTKSPVLKSLGKILAPRSRGEILKIFFWISFTFPKFWGN